MSYSNLILMDPSVMQDTIVSYQNGSFICSIFTFQLVFLILIGINYYFFEKPLNLWLVFIIYSLLTFILAIVLYNLRSRTRTVEYNEVNWQDLITEESAEDLLIQKYETSDIENQNLKSICTICLNDISKSIQSVKLNCGHEFHTNCLKKWCIRKNKCPLCRAELIDKSEFELYSLAKN